MDAAAWEAKVARLSDYARSNPTAYRRRVGALAALGYAYLIVGLIVLVALAVFVVVTALILLKLAIFLLAFAYSIVRSLWVKLPPPEGIAVTRADAPELWRLIDELRAELDAGRLHQVLLYDELNAGVVQIPRVGIFGWQKNYLLIGLPLMHALSEAEFRSVIAHELGHLSGNHSRFGGWIYRVRKTWTQLLARLEEERRAGSIAFRKFFEWYAPYFSAYSFALARADEFTADRAAAEAAGADAAGSGLVRLNLAGAYLGDKWWPSIFKQVEAQPEPPADVYRRLAGALPQAGADESVKSLVLKQLEARDEMMDTHPTLPDRLEALGLDPRATVEQVATAPPPSPNAASALLGSWEAEVVARLEQEWRQAVSETWSAEHTAARESDARLAELSTRLDSLNSEERSERALLTAQRREPAEAEPLLREAVAESGDDVAVNFVLGRTLIERGEEEGLRYLDRAMELDEDAVLPASELAFGFLMDQGREEDAERYRKRAETRVEDLEHAAAERERVTLKDTLLPAELTPEQQEAVRAELGKFEDVKYAYIARKHVDWEQDKPLFVIGIERRRVRLKPESKDADANLIQRLAGECVLPFDAYFIPVGDQANKKFGKKLRKIPGCLIYQAS